MRWIDSEVVAQRLGAREILRRRRAALAEADEVVGILAALDELGEAEELLGVAQRDQLAAGAHRADVEGGDVARQLAEGRVRPEHELRAVGHVLVAERPRAHRLDHAAARRAVHLVVHAQRNAVAVALVALPAAAERRDAHVADGRAVQAGEVSREGRNGEWIGHGVHPLMQMSGAVRATLRARPAASAASTTSETSL